MNQAEWSEWTEAHKHLSGEEFEKARVARDDKELRSGKRITLMLSWKKVHFVVGVKYIGLDKWDLHEFACGRTQQTGSQISEGRLRPTDKWCSACFAAYQAKKEATR